MSSDKLNFEIGDVVQIDATHDKNFGGCFMVITEPKSWGAQGYVTSPERPGALFYYRCPSEKMTLIGKAVWVASSGGEAAEKSEKENPNVEV